MIVIKDIFSFDLMPPGGKLIEIHELPTQSSIELNIRVVIGFEGKEAENIFDGFIVTGKCREKYSNNQRKYPYGGRVFLYDQFEPESILIDIRRKIHDCERRDQTETLREINKIMMWEFDDT